ncbi:MAG: SDR family oxidoreductase [Gammaproteobacteria bacterium]|nr:SDR family oxidoreductase [Gammaproteobacteria bacterium]
MNQIFSVEGKTILVTGGTRGIGNAIVRALVRGGASVIVNFVREQKKADAILSELGDKNLTFIRGDLTREKGMKTVVSALDGMTLDGLIHCAATGVHAPIEDLSLKHWEWTMNLNVRAFFDLIIRLQHQLNHGASVVALSSEGAVRAVPEYTLVGASKGALESLCRHLALDMCDQGVRFNILSPGSVLTDSWKVFDNWEERIDRVKSRIPGNELVALEEIASVALFLCSDASKGINGHTLVVDRGERIFL